MKHLFRDFIEENAIWDIQKSDKFDIIKEMADNLCEVTQIINKETFIKEIIEREKDLSTGIGLNIAIPHARIDGIEDFHIAIGRIKEGIPFNSLDDKPVKVIIMIAAPKDKQKEYIKLLAQIVIFAKNKVNFQHLLNDSPKDLFKFIRNNK